MRSTTPEGCQDGIENLWDTILMKEKSSTILEEERKLKV